MNTYKLTITGRTDPLYVEAATEQEALELAKDEIEAHGKSGDIELVED